MRHIYFIISLMGLCIAFTQAQAQSDSFDADRRDVRVGVSVEHEDELARERYETALARERAQQAYFNHQARLYESQQAQQEIYLRRSEQERGYRERSDDITNFNQLANSVASVARQVQVLSGGHGGW